MIEGMGIQPAMYCTVRRYANAAVWPEHIGAVVPHAVRISVRSWSMPIAHIPHIMEWKVKCGGGETGADMPPGSFSNYVPHRRNSIGGGV